MVHGRDAEREALRSLVEGARRGAGGSLLVLGTSGSGKSTMLLDAERLAGGFTVLRVRGVAAERELPYSGLHALLRPLCRPAREALGAVPVWAAPPGLALHAAVLDLLTAGDRPVLVCVDDAHLLDAASREALCFAARRAAGERLAVLFGGDPRDLPALEGVPALALGPLDPRSAGALLDEAAPAPPGPDLRAALLAFAQGNPLALTELAAALTAEQLAGTAPPPDSLPRHGRLWSAHAARLAGLPSLTRWLLLLIAADPALDPATLVRAAGPYGLLDALEPAEDAGIVRLGAQGFGFPEPGMRSVIYRGASVSRRRRAHRALAAALSGDADRLRRAWHRAVALDGPPDRLADELAAAALAARSPGDGVDPVEALERAAELATAPAAQARHLIAAARRAVSAGRAAHAQALLGRAHARNPPLDVLGRAELLRGGLELYGGATAAARDELLAAASHLLAADRAQGLCALVKAAEACYRAGDGRGFAAIADRVAAARAPEDGPVVHLLADYLGGVAATLAGRHREADDLLRRVVERARLVRGPAILVRAVIAGLLLGEDRRAAALATRAIAEARAEGALSLIPWALETLNHAEVWAGRYAAIARNALEGLRLAEQAGQPNAVAEHLAWLALTDAVQGDEAACRTRATSALALAEAHGLGLAGAIGTWALAHLDLAAGRPADALRRLILRTRHDHLTVRVMATPLLVEAAARTGRPEPAHGLLGALDRWSASTGSPDRLALAVRCRALLAPPDAADGLYREALDLHERGSCAFEAARTRLLYGRALRRNRRPGAAREQLSAALETFAGLEARLWAEQARAELRAAGARVNGGQPGEGETAARQPGNGIQSTGRLTAQQLRIARMVAEGATNREIAAALHLSPRTVEHHLRNVFVTLGIRSRVELARLLP
ncbi:AAA family ATPase [Thermoactinospora rubra]|uniref:AAA family ATPase n=1 Tax=Thermoactinospora rubra TaxID=1088767 RepID=UPI000A1217A9|nr:LuxR family transcriptional regulator [Thermoactinospora rubra]